MQTPAPTPALRPAMTLMKMARADQNLVVMLALLLGACGSGIEVTLPDPGTDLVDVSDDVHEEPDVGPADAGGAGDVAGDADAGDAADAAEAEVGPPPCPEGEPCDDGDPCTAGDLCDADGVCVGLDDPCDDGLACTIESCEDGDCSHELQLGYCLITAPAAPLCVPHGVLHPDSPCMMCAAIPPNPGFVATNHGQPCDDGDVCTLDDICLSGVCTSELTLTCDDLMPATCYAAACDPVEGCVEVPSAGSCDDGDVCTMGDVCAGGVCTPGAEILPCDDGDPCTVDTCDPVFGCQHAGGACDDGVSCTVDTCAPDGTCLHEAVVGACDDGDACTVGETCTGATCGGGAPVDCDDHNACTADACDAASGCQNALVEGTCDDGFACTIEDACLVGQCVGTKIDCGACEQPSVDHAAKITVYAVGEDGTQGNGLDLDGDLSTCAPAGDCQAGVDNALAVMAAVVNAPLTAAVEDGISMLVFEMGAATFDGQDFPLAIYDTELTNASLAAGCDYQAKTCSYYPVQTSFGPDCEAWASFDAARMSAGKLEAGGPHSTVSLVFDVSESSQFVLSLARAQVRGVYTLGDDGLVDSVYGVIGGAVPKQQLIDGILGVDEADLPIDKETAVSLLELLVVEDIDLDGDGTPDAASAGVRFEAIAAVLAPK